jgi:ketosteroid isomerase-like protein
MKWFLVTLVAALITVPVVRGQAVESGKTDGTEAVQHVLKSLEQAWNAHDARAYADNYWHSADLTIFEEGEVPKRWDAAFAANSKNFKDSPSALSISDVKIHLVRASTSYVTAWQVIGADGKPQLGLFMLVLRKFGNEWKIVHDQAWTPYKDQPGLEARWPDADLSASVVRDEDRFSQQAILGA